MVRIGATADQISEALGISLTTFDTWSRAYGAFSEALVARPIAFDMAQPEVNYFVVLRMMIKMALGYDYTDNKIVGTRRGPVVRAHSIHKPPSVKAVEFMLLQRLPARYGKRKKKSATERTPSESFLRALDSVGKSSNSATRVAQCPDEICRVLRTMSRLGAADFEMAAALGISLSAFKEMWSTHSGFSEALEAGDKELNEALERALIKRVMGYSYLAERFVCARDGNIVQQRKLKHVPPNAKAEKLWERAHPPE